jgi:hypothetical protein
MAGMCSFVTLQKLNRMSQMKWFQQWRFPSWVLLLVLATFYASCEGDDLVTVVNGNGSEPVGLLSDGQKLGAQVNDMTNITTINLQNLGKFEAPGTNAEVMGFTNGRPMAILSPIAWTPESDPQNLPFANQITIPVTVWIVKGPFAAQRTRAINHCIYTSGVWSTERMGVDFNPFQVVDATGDPDAANYFTFDCSMRAAMQADIGQTAGRINIYYVGTVDGGSSRGQACAIGSDFVAMGESTLSDLLSHEIGHDFALTHVDADANFDQTNIMHSASSTRAFITEGQLVRAHMAPTSAINDTYNARVGQPTRACAYSNAATDQCPAIQKRIWADGTFPAN